MELDMVDWSSLPSDLIRRVADCFLATNDIDYYMDMRAVCCSWRAAMADPCRPGADAHLPVFQPRQWIMLDEHSEDEHRLFVHVSSGRFLRRRIPLLRDHVLVSVSDGLLILGESKQPHAACVVNPFTGSLIRFAVPICPERILMIAVTCSQPMLVLYTVFNGHRILQCADPTSNFFSVQLSRPDQYEVQSMVSYAGHVYVADMDGSVFKIVGTPQHCYGELIANFPGEIPIKPTVFLVESTGDLLLVHDTRWGFFPIYRVDIKWNMLETVGSIGSRAIFLGPRSLSVDANKLPSIDSDCLYYQGENGTYMHDRKNGRESTISSMWMPQTLGVRPESLVQVLLSYCKFCPNMKNLMKCLFKY